MPTTAGDVGNEFSGLTDAPAFAGAVSRRWVNVLTGGHVSGVVWGPGAAEIALLHDAGRSARAWDPVILALGRPAVAIDLPGHGRSTWSASGDYAPRRTARPVAEAVRSFAPRHRLLVGHGLGALVALAAAARLGSGAGRVVLVDTLPETLATAAPWPWPSPEFDDADAAEAWLGEAAPWLSPEQVRREVSTELSTEDGHRLAWRHHLASLAGSSPERLDGEQLWALVGTLTVPPLLVRAEHGALTDEAVLSLLNARPDAEVVTVTGARHHVDIDQPDTLATVIRSALDEKELS